MSRLLGLDVGRKTIGIALSDTGLTIASPLKLITRSKMERDFQELAALIQQHDISRVVIGLPLHMNGGESEMSHYVRDFGSKLEASLNKEQEFIAYWDERLSTAAVFRAITAAEMSFKRRAEVKDKMAASFILQGYLDWLKNNR